ncbi:TPA: signal peptidase I [Streptococcus suis]
MKILKEIVSMAFTFAIVFIVALGIQRFILQPFVVDGHSMDYTLADGERLFMYKLGNIDRFDVVIIEAPNEADKMYVKRVIGLPGDTVAVENDQLILNGQAMEEPYLAQKQAETSGDFTGAFDLSTITGQTTIPDGYIFVMGDNRQNSLDGRSFGLIPMESVIGEANLIYWPFNKMGLLQSYELNDAGTAIVTQ